MLKFGRPPYLECSSKGDKRFSAFYAKVKGVSIEEQYQASKVFEDGSTGLDWKEAKGRKPVNLNHTRAVYTKLWRDYILRERPELQQVLLQASGFSDIFGQPGHCCQAEELWKLKLELQGSQHV